MDYVGANNSWDSTKVFLLQFVDSVFYQRIKYVELEVKFKMILEERKKLIKAINEKNFWLTTKIEVIDGLQQNIFDHKKMVFAKAIENEKFIKVIDGLNKKNQQAINDLLETKKNDSALSDQLTIEVEKKKTLELRRHDLLKEKKLVDEAT